MSILAKEVNKLSHHEKKEICSSRAKYREGRKDTAVRVYTVNQESCYLLIQNVPSVGNREELKDFCQQFGFVDDIYPLDDYPGEEFTDVYLVKYSNFPAARAAKKQLDNRSFFGGILHVCYAPEFESVEETRNKLAERRRYVISRAKSVSRLNEAGFSEETSKRKSEEKFYVDKSKRLKSEKTDPVQYMTYVWAGKEYTVPVSSPDANNEPLNYDIGQTAKKEIVDITSPLNCDAKNDVNSSETCGKLDVTKNKFFVPRQIKAKGENSSTSIPNQEVKKENSNLNPANSGEFGYPYDQTMEKIRQKLSLFSPANLAVNLKGKKS